MTFAARVMLAMIAVAMVTSVLLELVVLRGLEDVMLSQESERLSLDLKQRGEIFIDDVEMLSDQVASLAALPLARRAVSEPGVRDDLAERFVADAASNRSILQVRLIGNRERGPELVRVNGLPRGEIQVVPARALQDKGDRYYFQPAVSQPPGEVYISALDLNREQGQIENPVRPVLRLAASVYGEAGQSVIGAVIINLDMAQIFTRMTAGLEPDDRFYLANGDGEVLLAPDGVTTFAFEQGESNRLEDLWPELGASNRAETVGQMPDAAGDMFVGASVPLALPGGPAFTMVMARERGAVLEPVNPVRLTMGLATVGALALAIGLGYYFAHSMSSRVRQLTGAIRRIDEGDREVDIPRMNDEMGPLGEVLSRFVRRETLQRALIENASDAIITEDTEGRITEWNAAATALFGYERDEAIGQSGEMLVPEVLREERRGLIAKALAGGRPGIVETERLTRDGRMLTVSLSISPLIDPAGQVFGVASLKRDITETKQAEERFRKVFDACPTGLIIVGEDGRVILANDEATRQFGMTAEAFKTRTVDTLLPHNVAERHADLRAEYMANPSQRMMGIGRDLQARRDDGSLFPVEVGLTPMRLAGEPAVLAAVVDITQRREAENEITQYTRELERSNADLEQFAYVASHDLQEPLRMVSSFCALLEERYADKLDDDGREFIGFAVDGARRMQGLIGDLLTYSRISGAAEKHEIVDVNAVAHRALDALGGAVADSGAKVQIGELPAARGEASQLTQVFQNLLSNAIKFRGEDTPAVSIEGQRVGGMVRYTVTDNGIGIEPHHHKRVFGIFQRLHPANAYEGTGIGLALCQKIVQRLGGEIGIESETGQGTTVWFTLRT